MSKEADRNQITFFAKTNFRNREVPFGIKADDRRRHMYVIGKTGMGKTTLLENMAIQDIRNGHGVCFIDPHGDSVAKILNFVPNNRINDVIYLNPADLDYPIAFNILEAVDIKYKHLVADGLMGVFTKIWANLWSARMEYILNNTVLALLDSPGNTMLGITRMYVDKRYRKKIIDNIKDPMVRSFWVDEWANLNEKFRTEAVAPIQNKVGQFLSSAIIRNIVGQPKSTVDLRDIMDSQKVLLMDLSKGKVGEENSALLGAMIITKLQLAALSRVDIPEEQRADFYLYVDEFQNFATESFATILSEARKYHLNLLVGHQYIGQLMQDKNTVIRDAVFGNVGTIVSFRVGAADAEFLETEFAPLYTPNDLVNIPKYNVLLKLMINGVSSDPFSASTIPVNPEFYTGNAEKVIKVSRERYANPVDQVEEKISRWMGSDFTESGALGSGDEEEGGSKSGSLYGGGGDSAPERKRIPEPQAMPREEVYKPSAPSSQRSYEPERETVAPAPARLMPVTASEPRASNVESSATPPRPAPVERARESSKSAPQQQPRNSVSSAPRNNNVQQSRPPRDARPQISQRDANAFSGQKRNFDKPKPKRPPEKKVNPIWDTVAEIDKQKTEKKVAAINNDTPNIPEPLPLHSAATSEPQIPKDAQQSQTPAPLTSPKKVLEPGESIRFE